MTDEIRILIADDHAIVREGLRALIETEEGMILVGEAADGNEVVKHALTRQPDVILMDLVMPRKDGIAAIREIHAAQPEIPIIVLTSFAEDERVVQAIRAGATSYLLKDSSPQELLRSIQYAHRGEPYLPPAITRKLMHQLQQGPSLTSAPVEPLTEREVEVLRLIARGLSNQQIAAALFISERTARTHVSNILSKLDLENRTQAALYALREGLADFST